MTPLFGPSRRDRDQLIHTLRPLGPTTLGKLCAALGWSPRRTSKVVRTLYAEEFPGFHYDPVRGIVQVAAPPRAAPSAPAPGAPATSQSNLAGDIGRPWGASAQCPSCHVGMTSAGTDSTLYCPQCGRLSTSRSAPPAAAPTTPSPHPSASSGVPSAGDRRTQELFAAWVTSQPIACPKCRTNLQHRGVGQYACPTCGHKVAFPVSSSVPAPLATPARTAAPVALAPTPGNAR
ncbi:MAG: hypothetical protein L3K19_06995 [Thermoplasmata archaeon]|nr:hypothetical protein [Thermoplasmata archaeon]